jgi:hypothetical protein
VKNTNPVRRHTVYLLGLMMTAPARAGIADSTERFLGDAIAGFLDSLVVTQINSGYDIVMYIIIPFLGAYGITLYLTRKSFQIAEDNFRDSSYGSSDLSDQAKKTTTLIAASVSAVTVSMWGGFTPVIALFLGLIGGIFIIWQFWGAFQQTRWRSEGTPTRTRNTGNTGTPVEDGGTETARRIRSEQRKVEQEQESADSGEERVRREEKAAESSDDPEKAEESFEDLRKVVQLIQDQENHIEKILEMEYSELTHALEIIETLREKEDEIESNLEQLEHDFGSKLAEDLRGSYSDSEVEELAREFIQDPEKLEAAIRSGEFEPREDYSAFRDRYDDLRMELQSDMGAADLKPEEIREIIQENNETLEEMKNLRSEVETLTSETEEFESLAGRLSEIDKQEAEWLDQEVHDAVERFEEAREKQEKVEEVRKRVERDSRFFKELNDFQTRNERIRRLIAIISDPEPEEPETDGNPVV